MRRRGAGTGVTRRAGAPAMVVVVLAAGCSGVGGGGSGPPEVEVVERVGGVSADVVAVGDVLFAAPSYGGVGREGAPYRSEDGGRTWERLRLPDAPPRVDFSVEGPTIEGDVVVFTGREVVESDGMSEPDGAAYVWTSRDGRDWNASLLEERPSELAEVPVRAAGDVLIAGVAVGGDLVERPGTYQLYRSDDGGASWAPAQVATDLTVQPGGQMSLIDAWEHDGRLVADLGLGPIVAGPGDGAGGGPTTTGVGDGAGGAPSTVVVEPGGPPVTATARGGPTAGGAPPARTEAEALSGRPERPRRPAQSDEWEDDRQVPAVLESDDGGATWQLAPCPPPAVHSPEVCQRSEAHGDLLVRTGVPDRQVSVDGGETWEDMQIDVDVLDGPRIDSVLQVRSGLWMATASSEGTDTSRGFLLRSTDGIRWESVPPATLPRCGSSDHDSGFTPPVRFGGGWLVAYRCVDLGDPVHSMAYIMGGDGDLTPIPGSRRDGVAYRSAVVVGGPAVIGGHVVIGAERGLDPPDFVIVRP